MSTLAAPAGSATAPTSGDVVFAFFGVSWAGSIQRDKTMPEDRLADALLEHPRVRRVLIADPFRSYAGHVRARTLIREPRFPADARRGHYAPLRLRRREPVRPERFVARYEAGMRAAAGRLGLHRPAVIVAHPLVAGLGRFDWAGPVTYYGWDDWSASLPHRRWWDAYDDAYVEIRCRGRRVAAVSDGIVERIAPTGPHAVVPNGVEPAEWVAPPAPPAWFAAAPRPRLLYAGSLQSRIDVERVREVARAFPAGTVALVGPLIDPRHFAPLEPYRNVVIRPAVPRSEITALVAASDACLIPHVHNELTHSMSPLKLFEYLAAGRPVAATSLPPIAAVESPRLVLAGPDDSFAGAVQRALAVGPASEEERLAFAQRHGWGARFDRLLDLALEP